MPGTLLVSVLGLMDLPQSRQSSSTSSPPPSKDCLFLLKMAMGKTEYQTGDKGDFSFPVTSLRDNLKLTLTDADGNEISRTDVKTREVVEKKFWDSLFPLEGGGCVHLKLQFILNAEEHKRIREMRKAVLKKRHALSVTENSIGFSSNLISEGHLADRILLKSQDGREKRSIVSLPQQLQQQPEKHQKEDDICQTDGTKEASGTQVNEIDIHETNSSLVETMNPQLRCSGSISEEITATSSSPSAMAQEERNSSTRKEPVHDKFPLSNIKKMISAFESISVQEPRTLVGQATKSWTRKVKRGHSSIAPWSEEINTENVTNGKMMPKSFSTGTLPQMKSTPKGLTYTEVEEADKYSDLVIEKNLGNNKQFIESKDARDCKIFHPGNKQAISEFSYPAGSLSCERTSDMPEIIETKEVVVFCSSADIVKNVDQYPPHEVKENNVSQLREHEACQEKIGLCSFPEGVSFLDSETSYQNSDVTTSDCFEKEWSMLESEYHQFCKINKGKDEIVEGPTIRNQGGYPESYEGGELIHTNEIRKDEEAFVKDSRKTLKPIIVEQLCRSSMHEGQPNPSIVKAESGFSSPSDDFSEVPRCGSSDVKLDVLMYFDVHQCLLGSHGNCIPRHLCITSGSKKLKDILGGFTSM